MYLRCRGSRFAIRGFAIRGSRVRDSRVRDSAFAIHGSRFGREFIAIAIECRARESFPVSSANADGHGRVADALPRSGRIEWGARGPSDQGGIRLRARTISIVPRIHDCGDTRRNRRRVVRRHPRARSGRGHLGIAARFGWVVCARRSREWCAAGRHTASVLEPRVVPAAEWAARPFL